VFSGDRYFDFSPNEPGGAADIRRFYSRAYANIKRQATHYPPRKTFFGDTVPCYSVNDEPRFFYTDMFGGQTNIWGGTVLPLTEADFAGWPITRSDLEPHYQAIADLIGIAGRNDRLAEFLELDYGNRPPLRQLGGFEFLEDHLNRHADTEDYRFHAGVPPSAIDTRRDSSSCCIQCGECMVGCIRDSIYSARNMLRERIDRGSVDFVARNVVAIRTRDGRPEVCCADGDARLFDRVFLCAGCVPTSEIVMRSLELKAGPILQDNCIYQFPLVNLSQHSDRRKDEYFGLTNLLLLLEPRRPDLSLLQMHLYPNVDYLWRTSFPHWSWGILRHPVRWIRDRLIWARVYMDAEDSNRYSLFLEDDRLVFGEVGLPDAANVGRCIGSLRQALRGSGCHVLPFAPVLAHTSAHVAGTFPYGDGAVPVARDGEVMPRVHIADSACFPKSPVISPTLTIMANARRTALEAIQA
jgi:choline dehydrogenase-like flavoprotein